MRRFLLILFIVIIHLNLAAQKEANIWYFGEYAGMDFSDGDPVPLTNSSMSQDEGCATISNAAGELLFYTDGMSVWNRNHSIMQNGSGLMGHPSSTQSGIIVPWPLSTTKYFIFTVPAEIGTTGLRYSIVDMDLDNGMGAVTSVKNVFLISPTMEKVTGVRHTNGIDIWLITRLWNSDKFYAYLITADGLQPTAVISSVGGYQGAPDGDVHGSLKVSPNGKKIAMVNRGIQSFELFDFDNNTGAASNAIVFPSKYQQVYGLEFSPDCSKLYIGKYGTSSRIFQFDLNAGSAQNIIESEVQVGTVGNIHLGALQLAPDNKIYVSKHDNLYGDNYLGVINLPNEAGTQCNFVEDGFYLAGRKCIWGLPNFLQNYFLADFSYQPTCYGDTTEFLISDVSNIVSVLWDFGDPASGANNTSALLTPVHVFTAPGDYTVTLTIQYPANQYVTTHQVTIHPSPLPWLGNDTAVCSDWPFVLYPDQDYTFYLWQDGSTNPFFAVTQQGIYWVQVENEQGCTGTDSIQITFLPDPDITLGNDTLICYNDVVMLQAGAGFDSYLWQDGSQGQSLLVTQPGQYWVAVSNACGSGSDTINVNFTEPYDISLGNDTSFCYGHSITLDPGDGFDEYFWSTGAFSQTITATLGGTYWVQVTDTMGCTAMDSIYIDVFNDFEITIGSATQIICEGDYIFLNGPEGYQSYLWQDGSNGQSILADTAGIYWLEVTDENGCAARDSMELIVRVIADFMVNDTVLCEGGEVVLQAPPDFVSYLWHDGSTGSSYTATHEGVFWVVVTDELGCTGSDSVTVTLFEPPTLGLAQQEWICRGDSLWLQADTGHLAYLWQDGTTTPEYLVTMPGLYQVQIETICGKYENAVKVVFYTDNLNLGRD
ncbi:MAG: PKD domain-containing protein, partial [Bacteroidales bacterium]